MTTPRTPPPYSEAQATAWLAWLAYHMRRRDMTIFQIESLQPDWLVGWKETATHLLFTRALWGLWSGLMGGLPVVLIAGLSGTLRGELIVGLIAGLVIGLIVGLIGGLIELVIPTHKLNALMRTQGKPIGSLITETLIYGLILGLIVGPIFGLIVGLNRGLNQGLLNGVMGGLLAGTLNAFIGLCRIWKGHIRTIESLYLSWRHARQNAKAESISGLKSGLSVGAIIGLGVVLLLIMLSLNDELNGKLIFLLIRSLIVVLAFGLIGGLIFGLVGLILGLISGVQRREKLKTRPNQGIWLTIQTALKVGLSTGLIIGVPLSLLSKSIAVGLLCGVVISLFVGGWSGGLDVIEHGIVRLILAWRGHAPLNYARFLDYAADELQFLQKVGGGYIFIHRYLLEHFAELAVEKGYVAGEADRPPT